MIKFTTRGAFATGVFLILIISIGYFAYTTWEAYSLLTNKKTIIDLSEVQIQENKKNIRNALVEKAGVNIDDALRGFWYSYVDENSTEQVAFLSVDELAKRGLTEWQIANIVSIVGDSRIYDRDNMSVVAVSDMPDEYQFHNALYKASKDEGFIKGKKALERRINSGEYNESDLFKLGYIYEIEGKYGARDELYNKSCAEFGTQCGRNLRVIVTGKVVDMEGAPIQSATVSVLSAGNINGKTDKNGVYNIEIPIRKMEKIRIKAYKRNYSDGIANAVAITEGKKKYIMDDIVLASPIKIVTLNNILNTVTGEGNIYKDDAFIIQTQQSVYTIPSNSIVYENGAPYTGEVDVYLYEFTRDTAPESLLAVDTMDSVVGYAGDLMKSFGMPYIQFFTPEGEELHVLKSNPMKIQYRIYHMEELYNNTDGIYTALTAEDMENLVFASLGGNYPINREYLIENNLLQFPAFWVFDRTVGIWENVGVNVLTADGLIESIFYTINDMR